jgi:hypothetical protein
MLYRIIQTSNIPTSNNHRKIERSLLQEFEDVFPHNTPSKLPPLRGIEHQIDLVPGASIPNCPTYRSNPEDVC